MAASLPGVLNEDVREKVASSRILVVGAGGIGCELLKNLVLTGFVNIETVFFASERYSFVSLFQVLVFVLFIFL